MNGILKAAPRGIPEATIYRIAGGVALERTAAVLNAYSDRLDAEVALARP